MVLENLLDNNPLAIVLVTKNKGKSLVLRSLKEDLEKKFFLTTEDIEKVFDKESDLNIERTKSLFQSINYSYKKLSNKEKLALEILSLFPDGLILDNFRHFYKEKERNVNSFSERDITLLESKSLVIINNGFVTLQSIIGRFAEFRFDKRENEERMKYYKKSYDFLYFFISLITDNIDNDLRKNHKVSIFDNNKQNFIKSVEYLKYFKNDESIFIYLDRLVSLFSMKSTPNKKLILKIKEFKNKISDDLIKKDFVESLILVLGYYYGDFYNIFSLIKKEFPLEKIISISKTSKNDTEIRMIQQILNIYAYEGYVIEYIRTHLDSNWNIVSSDLFLIGDYELAEKILKYDKDDDSFFISELLFNLKKLDIETLKKIIKSLHKTEYISKVQLTYILVKENKEEVDVEDIRKLVETNPFTEGLKLLMFAMKDENDNTNLDYEDAIKKLYHIKYYHVEAILIYSRYLKDIGDEDYIEWFEKGKELADKHHYQYLLHQFICLDSGVYTDYDENNYPLPEPLDYSGIIKKYGLDVKGI